MENVSLFKFPIDMMPFAISQSAQYFMPTATGAPPPPPPPPSAPPPTAPILRFPISPINQTALALRDALGMVPPGYSANITHINCKLISEVEEISFSFNFIFLRLNKFNL